MAHRGRLPARVRRRSARGPSAGALCRTIVVSQGASDGQTKNAAGVRSRASILFRQRTAQLNPDLETRGSRVNEADSAKELAPAPPQICRVDAHFAVGYELLSRLDGDSAVRRRSVWGWGQLSEHSAIWCR
jgi:hypothetical protein